MFWCNIHRTQAGGKLFGLPSAFIFFVFVCKINLFSLLFSGFVVIVKTEVAKEGNEKQEGRFYEL